MIIKQLVLVLIYLATSKAKSHSTTVIEKKKDLESSASSYSYHSNHGTPFNIAKIEHDMAPVVADMTYPDETMVMVVQEVPQELPPITAGAEKYQDLKMPLIQAPTLAKRYVVEKDKLKPLYPYAEGYYSFLQHEEPKPFAIEKSGKSKGEHAKESRRGAARKKFVKEGGSSYDEAHKAEHGEKADTAYDKVRAFAKGLKGEHENEESKSYHEENGGHKKGYHDNADRYGEHHAHGHEKKGGAFGENKGHDKGSKTSGYHTVFMKDDYIKDHSFYDRADKHGSFDRHGKFNAKHYADAGSSKEGKKHDSGFKELDYGAKGKKDKGHFEDESEGYKREGGKEKHHNEHSEYGHKGGKKSGSEHGYEKEH
nr:unnamed protein product [Callosobruchus chinensis]